MQSYENFFRDKTVLITGGLGFIGSNLAIRLNELNPKKIIIVDSLVPSLGGNIQNIDEIKNKSNLEIYSGAEGDIKNIEKMKPLIQESDVIFNLAGSVKHTKLDEKDLEFDTEINFTSQIRFLEACRQVMVENPTKKLKIVFSGTRDQYGKVPQSELPVKEYYQSRNMTDYQSVTKNASEFHHMIINNVLRDSGIDVMINSVRLINTYGPRQSGRIGAAIPVFVEKAINGEIIELWGGGEVFRDVNYVDDVVDALLLIVSLDVHGEVFNLGSCIGKFGMENPTGGNFLSVKNLAEKIVNVSGSGQIKTISYPQERKTIEPGHFAADISKIYNLGWKPKTSLDEGLIKTISWFKSKTFSVK